MLRHYALVRASLNHTHNIKLAIPRILQIYVRALFYSSFRYWFHAQSKLKCCSQSTKVLHYPVSKTCYIITSIKGFSTWTAAAAARPTLTSMRQRTLGKLNYIVELGCCPRPCLLGTPTPARKKSKSKMRTCVRASFELATQNIWNYFVSRTQNFDTFVCCCLFYCCCCCWGSGTLHVAVNGPGRCWNERWTHWPWLDCLMLLAKGPILISILINFGTFEKQSQQSCQQPQCPTSSLQVPAHASMTIASSTTPTSAMYILPETPTEPPAFPEVALFVLEIPSLRAIQIAVDNCNTSYWKRSNDNISFNEL